MKTAQCRIKVKKYKIMSMSMPLSMAMSTNYKEDGHRLSRARTIVSASVLLLSYMFFGILMGLMPQIYPEEARRRGLVASEVRDARN